MRDTAVVSAMRSDSSRLPCRSELCDFFNKPVVLATTKKANQRTTPAMPRGNGEEFGEIIRQTVAPPRNASPPSMLR